MANDLNKVIIIGRLTADPELKQTPNGVSVISASIAVNEKFKDKENCNFFNCVFWNKSAEILKQYCAKGAQLAITGRLQQRRWDDKDGSKRSTVEIVVDSFQMLGGKKDNNRNDDDINHAQTYPADGYVVSNDDIPF